MLATLLPDLRTAVFSAGECFVDICRAPADINKTPEEIYQTGLNEVARIRRIMDSVKNAVGFSGDLPAFLNS